MELPDREHLGGWAAILAELNRDNARVDKDIEVEALASVEEEEPVGPDDGRGFAGAGDKGGRRGGRGEANGATLEGYLGMAIPVTSDSIASGEGRDQRALEDIDRVDRVDGVEKRRGKEGDSLLDGLSEDGRHGGIWG